MKYIVIVFLILILATGCAKHSAYETARLRDRDYEINAITLTDGGLSESQIKRISSTKLPTSFPVDISIILVKNGYVETDTEQLFVKNVIDALGS